MNTSPIPKKLFRFWNERLTRIARSSGFSTGLLVASSAALGGIAVALWNRKTLATFHQLNQQEYPAPSVLSDEIDDLFCEVPTEVRDEQQGKIR